MICLDHEPQSIRLAKSSRDPVLAQVVPDDPINKSQFRAASSGDCAVIHACNWELLKPYGRVVGNSSEISKCIGAGGNITPAIVVDATTTATGNILVNHQAAGN